MKSSFNEYFSTIMTSIGTIFGAIGLYIGFQKNPNFSLLQWLLISSSILFFFLFLLVLRFNIRNRRYKYAYSEINKAFAVVNELNENEIKINSLTNCIEHFEIFCTHLSKTFELLTNRSCSVCIKIFEQSKKYDVCTITFCRDNESKTSDKRVSIEEDKKNYHFLRENTDFRFIFENINKDGEKYKYFFSNYLPLLDYYSNSRIDPEIYPPKCNIPLLKELIRLIRWPLPYRSTITVPITLFSNRKINEGKIAGYLCVDSPRMGVFNNCFDVQILRGIADGIYTPVKRINEIHFNSIHKCITFEPKSKENETQ